MAKQPGSIFPVEGGRKLKGVVYVKDELGFSKQKTFTTTNTSSAGRKALRARMNGYLEQYSSHVPAPDMSVKAMCEAAIKECERLKRSPNTIEGYKEFLEWHIGPTIGKVKVAELKPFHVERMIRLMAEGKTYCKREVPGPKGEKRIIVQPKASTQTQLLCRNFLRSAINRIIVKNGIRDKSGHPITNAAALAETEKVTHKKQKPITVDALSKILANEPNEVLRALWMFLADTGLRPTEARLVTWHDLFELEDGLWLQLSDSKTEMGKEPVPISKRTAEALKAIKRNIYVFPTKNGTPIGDRNLSREWYQVLERAGLPKTNPYQTRKLFGTMKARVVKDEILRRLMRHQDVRTTKQFYVNALDEDLRRAVEE